MMDGIKKLIEERDRYLAHDENLLLQEKELYSIANAMKAVAKEATTPLTKEDEKALEWADNFIKTY